MTITANTHELPRTLTYSFPQISPEMLPGHELAVLRLQARDRRAFRVSAYNAIETPLPHSRRPLVGGACWLFGGVVLRAWWLIRGLVHARWLVPRVVLGAWWLVPGLVLFYK